MTRTRTRLQPQAPRPDNSSSALIILPFKLCQAEYNSADGTLVIAIPGEKDVLLLGPEVQQLILCIQAIEAKKRLKTMKSEPIQFRL